MRFVLENQRLLRAGAAVLFAVMVGFVIMGFATTNPDWFLLAVAAGFILLAWILIEVDAVYQRNRSLQRRTDELFDRTEIAVLRFDFSAVVARLRQMAVEPHEIEEFLQGNLALLDELFGEIRVLTANDAARRAIRLEGVDLPVRLPPHVQPLNRAAASAWLGSIAQGALDWAGVVWFPGTDEPGRWYQMRHLVAVDDDDYSDTVVTGTDITAVMEAQAALHKLDEAKNEFIASVTHEMRTPLAGVVGFSSELDNHFDTYEPELVREMVSLISRQSREISHILDDLMAVAAAEMTALKVAQEEFDVPDLVAEVVDSVGLSIDVHSDGVTQAEGDPLRVRQIMRNLLTNVERYGGPHRRIVISSEEADFVAVHVVDDGPGLTDQRVKEIFAQYGVVDSSGVHGSMGLGLNISRTLAHLMGASLDYRRIDDETHFVLRLPTVKRGDAASSAS